jgi:hypothetical protein
VVAQRQDDAIARSPEERGGGTEVGRRHDRHLVRDLVDRREISVVTEAQREFTGDPPVVHGGALGRDLAPETLDAAFDVGHAARLLTPQRAREKDVGAAVRFTPECVHRDHGSGGLDRPPCERGIREVCDRVGAEQHENSDLAVSGGPQHAFGIKTARTWRCTVPRSRVPVGARVQSDPPRQKSRCQPRVECAVHVRTPQGRQELHVGQLRQRCG